MTSFSEHSPLLQKVPVEDEVTRRGPCELNSRDRMGILVGAWIATFLSLTAHLRSPVVPSISSEFHKSNQASWLGTSYLLATCTFMPLYGRLSDAMGRRAANQTAILLTALGTLACALAPNMELLILARFVAGLGGGGIMTTTTIVVNDLYSLRSRGLAQGVMRVFDGLGMGLGGPIGGIITDRLGWRCAFLGQLPLFALSFSLITWHLSYTVSDEHEEKRNVLSRVDWWGCMTLMLAWADPHVVIPLYLSLAFFALFLLVELRVAPEPVLAPFLLKQAVPVLTGISNFLVAACNYSITFYFPMWFQTVMLASASTAGLHLLPLSVAMSVGSMLAGYVMHRSGRYKALNLTFGILPLVSTVLIYLIREDSNDAHLWLSIIPLGFGNAVVLQTMLKKDMAVGTGFGQLWRGVGQVCGVAVSSAIFQSRLETELRARISGDELVTRIRLSASYLFKLDEPTQRLARDAYNASLKSVFLFAMIATGLAYTARLFIPDKKLDQQCPKVDPPAYRSVPPSDQGDTESIAGTLTTIDEDDEADMDMRSSFEELTTRTRRDSDD
ncbi:MFS general substrate transporter [Schizophyllum commune H4-8]|uniref:MFS general substrate transporter n=1 Tax=Schizophyllum commune (strain H4-8 / FGSC 9210) TaxID=578458 RepID=UPI0021605818|nr:MFS general substrate transporter [Schizophyllum commune H4-8]KAI5899095.1 MFS general substrate transporter [Schizophyllum commune H4-8]